MMCNDNRIDLFDQIEEEVDVDYEKFIDALPLNISMDKWADYIYKLKDLFSDRHRLYIKLFILSIMGTRFIFNNGVLEKFIRCDPGCSDNSYKLKISEDNEIIHLDCIELDTVIDGKESTGNLYLWDKPNSNKD